MCRLFGLLSSRDESAEPWLLRSDRSLFAQSNVSPDTAQKDGWGVGWFENGGRARVEKGTGGAFEAAERDRYAKAAREAHGPLILGHLRHASNPLHLPRERLIAVENSQPFENHTTLFAHNGSIPFPTETRPLLGVHEPKVRGVNDSEVLFWLLVRNTEETGDPLVGYLRTVEDLVRVWQGLKRPPVPPFSGLNVLFSRGPDELWAFCQWTGDHGTGLIDTSRRYYEMTYQATPHRVLVGSEPFDGARGVWQSLASGTYLVARRTEGRLDVKTSRLPFPASLELQPLPA
jgi:predicted glutamine amidotransferase